jgi:hypothetical protein
MIAFISAVAITLMAYAFPALANPVLGVSVTATASASATSTSIGPNPTEVYINSIAYGGTGCPQGSVGSFISADRTTLVSFEMCLMLLLTILSFTLIFDDFVASIGPGIAITESRLNCQINLDLEYPTGFQYSILNTDFRGYAGLDKGVTGVQQATYYFSGCM